MNFLLDDNCCLQFDEPKKTIDLEMSVKLTPICSLTRVVGSFQIAHAHHRMLRRFLSPVMLRSGCIQVQNSIIQTVFHQDHAQVVQSQIGAQQYIPDRLQSKP